MEEITLEIIEQDLLKIIPERSDDIIRYFRLLQNLNNSKMLAKIVNTEEEFSDIEKDTKELYNEVESLKKRSLLPSSRLNDKEPDTIQIPSSGSFKNKRKMKGGKKIK